MIHLLVRFEGAEERFTFTQDVISLGRTAQNTIQVKDPKASRNHAEIRRVDDGWKLVDLESSNGTSINGEKANTQTLKPGDVIAIGLFEIVFQPDKQPMVQIPPKVTAEPIEKTVVDTQPPRPVPAAADPRARMFALARKITVAAAVLVGGLIVTNQIRGSIAERRAQESAYKSAVSLADSGDYEDAIARLEAFIVTNPEADLLKRASAKRDEFRTTLARTTAEAKARRDRDFADLLTAQMALNASSRFEAASAQIDAYLAQEDFAGAVDEAKRFLLEAPEGALRERMSEKLRGSLAAAAESWDALQDKVNAMTRAEKYGEAIALLGSQQSRYSGTRFGYEIASKTRAIQRLSGVTAAYASGAPEMSAAAQESMLAVGDLVKARRYAEALKALDKALSGMGPKEREGAAGRKIDIERQASIFGKLHAAINSGALKDRLIDLGGGVNGWLSQAADLGVTIEFRDPSGKGGTTGRKWTQVPGADMLAYFRFLELNETDLLGLAAFCYENRLAESGAEILFGLSKQEALRSEVFGLIARVRQMGVPADGFVYYERGWYTGTEFTYAKLDHKARKGAGLVAKIDTKSASEGYRIYREIADDGTLTPEFKAVATGYYVKELRAKRQAIMKSLQSSPAVSNFKALQDMKRQLNLVRAEAIRVIYDKTIYPDENHGVEGQPVVDDAVKLVRDLWEKPLKTVVLDEGVRVLVEAGQTTNGWLAEMGESANDADLEEFENLLSAIGEKLHLRNVCLDARERKLLEYNRKVWEYNRKNDGGMSGFEIDCITITNEYREMMGREILQHDELLGKTAEKHSTEMVEMAYFAHESPISTRRTPMDRAKLEGYTGGVGENIATGYGSPKAAFDGWYNSSGHHRNMLSDAWNHIGIGCVNGTMWTENLGRAASHLGTESREDKSRAAPGRRGGVNGGGDGDRKAADPPAPKKDEPVKAGSRSNEKGAAPAQPDGKCIGTEPFDPNKDKKPEETPAPKDKPAPDGE
ncbi:MAG: FHA domain-containing protein [Candidatus Brocadiae bacterium]|nr:FHA domain-containing protein [Candidatus Brocadiia bacterium]